MSRSFLRDRICHLCHVSDFSLLLHSAWILPRGSALLHTVYDCVTFLTTVTTYPKAEFEKGRFVPVHHWTAPKRGCYAEVHKVTGERDETWCSLWLLLSSQSEMEDHGKVPDWSWSSLTSETLQETPQKCAA